MEIIQRAVLQSDTAGTISLSNIPNTYTHLRLIMNTRSTYTGGGAPVIYLKFNNSSSGYAYRWLVANNGAVQQPTANSGQSVAWVASGMNDTWTANARGSLDLFIPGYTSSINKSYSAQAANLRDTGDHYLVYSSGSWNSSSVISSIDLSLEVGNWKSGSTFSLYGISSGSDGITTVT